MFCRTILLIAVCLISSADGRSQVSPREQLRFVLILSRHGIRTPLQPPASLNAYSSQPWPTWEVPLGYLTPHGSAAIREMGAYMRLDLAHMGLFSASGCLTPSEIYFYSDIDERNISSTHSTFDGFAPGCKALSIHTVGKTSNGRDPLFFPLLSKTFSPPADTDAINVMTPAIAVLGEPSVVLSGLKGPEVKLLSHVLAPDSNHPAPVPILDIPVRTTFNPSGDPIVFNFGPFPAASRIVEAFFLEYIDGKPLSQVGWGRVNEVMIRKLVPIHITDFSLAHRTSFFAKIESSNLLAHILATLTQATTNASTPGAIGPVGTRLVYISGLRVALIPE